MTQMPRTRPTAPSPDAGEKNPAAEANAIREEGNRTPPRTNDLGQFNSANQNPFPVPNKYRNGVDGPGQL